MGSRRSSDTSTMDKFSKGSISLEFDDYPLDLISPVRKEDGENDPGAWKTTTPHAMTPSEEKDAQEVDLDLVLGEVEYVEEDEEKKDLNEQEYCDTIKANGTVLCNRNSATPRSNGKVPGKPHPHDNILYDVLKDYPIHKHRRTGGRCEPCQTCCISCWRPCLTKYHPLPQNPTYSERLRHGLMCPPHGWLGHVFALIFCTAFTWGILWAITGPAALPGGNIFALVMMVIFGYIGGALVRLIRLPPLLGMLLVGCLMRNLPVVNIAEDIDSQWAGALRNAALVVVLLRAGLGLDPHALRKLSMVVIRLAFLPWIFETIAVAVAARLLLGFPWLWGFLLGFVLSAVTPAVVVPTMLSLASRGYGKAQGIPTLVIAAASIDDVLAISGFTILLAIIFSESNLALTIFRGPLEAISGIMYGTILGVIFWYIPDTRHKNHTMLRFLLLLSGGMFAAFGSRAAKCPGSGALGCLVLAFVAGHRWRKQGWKEEHNPVDSSLGKLWLLLEPLMFGLIGAELDIHRIDASTIGLGVAVVFIGSAIRMVVSFVAVLGAGLSLREKFFIPFAWLPKATVQAAIGAVALDTARAQDADEATVDLGIKVVVLAVLAILLMAPLGGAAMCVLGPRLLSREPDLSDDSEGGDRSADLTWDDHLDFDTELTKTTMDALHLGRATERETVT